MSVVHSPLLVLHVAAVLTCSHVDVGDLTLQHINSTASLDMCSDQSAAAAAIKVEQLTEEPFDVTAAHLFLQRVLYKINRLNHFW